MPCELPRWDLWRRQGGHDPGRVAANAAVLLAGFDEAVLARLRAVRASARELAWAQGSETRDWAPISVEVGRPIPGLVLDPAATIVICHSEAVRIAYFARRIRLCVGERRPWKGQFVAAFTRLAALLQPMI